MTGCGEGIGRAILERLRDDGFLVVGIERDELLAESARELLGAGCDVVTGDVTDRDVLAQAGQRARELGELYAWANNAAVGTATNLHAPVPEDVYRVLDVNLFAYYWGCSTAIQSFIAQRLRGSIVNISSVHGRAAFGNAAAYDVSKAGVDALTRYVAVEYGPLGIRANAVAPGGVLTPAFDRLLAESGDPVRFAHETAVAHPLRRMAEAREIAAVVSFLLSDDASFVSGQSLAVDGGLTSRCVDFELDPDLAAAYGLTNS